MDVVKIVTLIIVILTLVSGVGLIIFASNSKKYQEKKAVFLVIRLMAIINSIWILLRMYK